MKLYHNETFQSRMVQLTTQVMSPQAYVQHIPICTFMCVLIIDMVGGKPWLPW